MSIPGLGRKALVLIHSLIPDISIAPLQVHYYSEALLSTALILCHELARRSTKGNCE